MFRDKWLNNSSLVTRSLHLAGRKKKFQIEKKRKGVTLKRCNVDLICSSGQ